MKNIQTRGLLHKIYRDIHILFIKKKKQFRVIQLYRKRQRTEGLPIEHGWNLCVRVTISAHF